MKTVNSNRIKWLVMVLCIVNFGYSQNKVEATHTITKSEMIKTQTDILSFLKASKSHTILVEAIQASGLEVSLSGEGPFTLFAPTDAAFWKLPKGTLESLLKPENIEKLKSILTYHIIPGNFNSSEIVKAIENNAGETDFRTLNKLPISAYVSDGVLILTDAAGNDAEVETADQQQTNGFIHVINAVVMPN